jgi:hypothetical protein
MNITKEQLAIRLTGREYGDEIDRDEERLAKESGLFVIFGASDDLAEIRGVHSDELNCYGGSEWSMTRKGVVMMPDDDETEVLEKFGVLHYVAMSGAKITALWCNETGYSWTYKTEIPHATFEIVEDGDPYCRGIIIDSNDLPEP